jgi:hypothetical protein
MKPKADTHVSQKTSRRQFAKSVATTLVAAPLVAQLAKAQMPTKPKETTAPPNPQPGPTPQKLSPLAEAYAEAARIRFGEKWTPEQLEQIKKDFEGYAGKDGVADRLRAVKLKNGDEPDFVFNAG